MTFHLELGDLASWVEALGVTGTFVYAFRGWSDERHRSLEVQARRIAVRVVPMQTSRNADDDFFTRSMNLAVSNRSDESIMECSAYVWVTTKNPAHLLDVRPSHQTLTIGEIGVIEDHVHGFGFRLPVADDQTGAVAHEVHALLTFTDQFGQRWTRSTWGERRLLSAQRRRSFRSLTP